MNRRLTLLVAFIVVGMAAEAQINIWEGTSCRKTVEMEVFPVDEGVAGSRVPSVIVCPGGSYFWHDMNTEGSGVAHWLQQNGITAFVLRYRTAGFPAFFTHYRRIFRGKRYPDAQNDLLQAIRFVKRHADDFGIDTCRIGAMGFSAGGHLVMSAAEFFPSAERPAYIAAIYPVVTMSEPCTHKRSRRALLGESRSGNRKLRDSLSLERHVPADCPPVFLVNCKDDDVVDSHNSALLDAALTAAGVPHEWHHYQTGGHGFGASETKGTPECRQWKQAFLSWLRKIDVIKNL